MTRREIHVLTYNPKWKKKFEAEATILRDVFGDLLLDIHHIGSTSIPNMNAKPIIDILISVADIEAVESFNDKMKSHGYESRGEQGIPGRRYFRRGLPQHSHHVHVYQIGDPNLERHIAFRDYLITHSARAIEYSKMKASLAQQFRYDPVSYNKGKAELAAQIESEAIQWFRKRQKIAHH